VRLIALETTVGLSIGAMIGIFAAIARKRDLKTAWLDALLGAIGFVGAARGIAVFPWHHTTSTKEVAGMIVTTTVMHYPNPYRIALAAALILPVLLEIVRSWRARGAVVQKSNNVP
jgi:hypothetical protein